MKLYVRHTAKYSESLRRRGLAPATIERHGQNITYFKRWLRSKHVNRENLNQFITYYQKKHRPNTVNSAICTLKDFCVFLRDEKLIKEELHYYLRAMRREPFNPFIPTTRQVLDVINCQRLVNKYLKWLDTKKYDLFFKMLASLALRRFEALNLKVGDIDFNNNEVRIIGKGSFVRALPLPQVLRDDLRGWFGERKAKRDEWIFQSRNGTRCGAAVFSDELKKRMATLGINEAFTLHTFRRYWITEAVRSNMNTTMIMKFAGHTNFATHLRYVKLVSKDLQILVDEHPISRLPGANEAPETPKVPYILAKNLDDFRVN